jgi:hypothetical protein
MAYYVNKDAYRGTVRRLTRSLTTSRGTSGGGTA